MTRRLSVSSCCARVVVGAVLESAGQLAYTIDDPLSGREEFVGLHDFEVGEVGGIATVDNPWVEHVKIVWSMSGDAIAGYLECS